MPIRRANSIDLLQGTLDMLVLEQLRWAPNHGYGIAQAIRAQSGDILRVDAGSLYPALHRLERQKLVRAQWTVSDRKQRTRVYRLTPLGRRRLAGDRSRWEQLSLAIGAILNRGGVKA
jgi:PadR family transcriptional regulator PadR